MDALYGVIEERHTTSSGETTVRSYQRGKLLGKGGFARCYEVKELESEKLLAAKIIEKSSLTKGRAKQKLQSEIRIHRSLHHPNVVRLERHFEDDQRVYLIMELCPNQTLKELVKKRKRLHEL